MAKVVDIHTNHLLNYTLQLADSSMILGQRLSEWCGHGPVLEQDIAITNIALDLIGEARTLYQYAAEIEGNGKTEDDYPFLRGEREWRNLLLVEQPNGDFAHTIVRQFMFDCYHYYHLEALAKSSDEKLAAIATKTIKEARYHLRYSSEWMIRLGDGTEESHQRMQTALENRIHYFEEAFTPSSLEQSEELQSIAPACNEIAIKAKIKFEEVCRKATLNIPEVTYPLQGGKEGLHSEHMGFILTELQYLQKTYPNSNW